MVLIDEDGPSSHSCLPRLHSDKAVHSAADLGAIYGVRFQNQEAYRKQVWSVLAKYFSRWIPSDSVVVDVGVDIVSSLTKYCVPPSSLWISILKHESMRQRMFIYWSRIAV
jgi:hypothetical protein